MTFYKIKICIILYLEYKIIADYKMMLLMLIYFHVNSSFETF